MSILRPDMFPENHSSVHRESRPRIISWHIGTHYRVSDIESITAADWEGQFERD
jgi:hypothetical protein